MHGVAVFNLPSRGPRTVSAITHHVFLFIFGLHGPLRFPEFNPAVNKRHRSLLWHGEDE